MSQTYRLGGHYCIRLLRKPFNWIKTQQPCARMTLFPQYWRNYFLFCARNTCCKQIHLALNMSVPTKNLLTSFFIGIVFSLGVTVRAKKLEVFNTIILTLLAALDMQVGSKKQQFREITSTKPTPLKVSPKCQQPAATSKLFCHRKPEHRRIIERRQFRSPEHYPVLPRHQTQHPDLERIISHLLPLEIHPTLHRSLDAVD